MARKALINLTTGLEDPERVTVAFLVGGAALERHRLGALDRRRRPAPACPICWDARKLDQSAMVPNCSLTGATPMFDWIGDDDAAVFSY